MQQREDAIGEWAGESCACWGLGLVEQMEVSGRLRLPRGSEDLMQLTGQLLSTSS